LRSVYGGIQYSFQSTIGECVNVALAFTLQ
jgi:hypothetical protein